MTTPQQISNVGSPLVATETNPKADESAAIGQRGDETVATSSDPTACRKYPRANFHDYNGGVYFVTVCTKSKRHYFGNICDQTMHLSEVGKELQNQLGNISLHYSDVDILMYVIMPNHFHAIVAVESPLVTTEIQTVKNLGRLNQLARLTVATSGDPTLTTHHGCRLGNIISAIKAGVTRFARRNDIEFGWQPRYHDHIIRGNHDGNQIAEYIKNNVTRWENDCFYGE